MPDIQEGTPEARAFDGKPLCKGDWSLGTACGRCERCLTNVLGYVSLLKQELDLERSSNASLNEKLTLIKASLPMPMGFDISDKFKLACFEEARRVLWTKDE